MPPIFVRQAATWDGSRGNLSFEYIDPHTDNPHLTPNSYTYGIDKVGSGVNHRVNAYVDGQHAGYMDLDEGDRHSPHGLINMVQTHKDFRGTGLARAMGEHFENEVGITPVHSDILSHSGQQFAMSTPQWPTWNGRGVVPSRTAFYVRSSDIPAPPPNRPPAHAFNAQHFRQHMHLLDSIGEAVEDPKVNNSPEAKVLPFVRRKAAVDPQTANDYHTAFNAAMANSPHKSFVSAYHPDEIASMHSAIVSPDKKSGVLVHDHGDGRVEATGLFNSSGVPGTGSNLMNQAMSQHGVNYAEAYGPKLPQIYEKLGFKTVEQYPFDKSLASPDWDYEKFGTPDYHIMTKGGVPLHQLQGPSAAPVTKAAFFVREAGAWDGMQNPYDVSSVKPTVLPEWNDWMQNHGEAMTHKLPQGSQMFHGSPKKINQLEDRIPQQSGESGPGFYTTPNENIANWYSNNFGGTSGRTRQRGYVHGLQSSADLNLLDRTTKQGQALWKDIGDYHNYQNPQRLTYDRDALRNQTLQQLGFHGVKNVRAADELPGEDAVHEEYNIFNPTAHLGIASSRTNMRAKAFFVRKADVTPVTRGIVTEGSNLKIAKTGSANTCAFCEMKATQKVEHADGHVPTCNKHVGAGIGQIKGTGGTFKRIKKAAIPEKREVDSEHDSGMIALIPSAEYLSKLTVPDGDDESQLHLTLFVLGDTADWTNERKSELLESVDEHIDYLISSDMDGKVFAHAEFNPGENQCSVYLVSGIDSQLEHFMEMIQDHNDLPDQHSPWIPHITAGFGVDPNDLDYIGDIEFDTLRVVWSGETYDFKLTPQVVKESKLAFFVRKLSALYGPGDWHHAQQWHQDRMNNVNMGHIHEAANWSDSDANQQQAANDHLEEHEFNVDGLENHYGAYDSHDSTLGQHPHYTDIAANRWADTFGAARGTRKAAWDLLGAPQQAADPDPHRDSNQYQFAGGADLAGVNPDNANHAYSLMHGIHNAQLPVQEELHRFVGHVDPKEFMSKVKTGDEFHLPPTSFANVSQPDSMSADQYEQEYGGYDDREESPYNNLWNHFTGGDPQRSMVFKVQPGAKAVGGMDLGEEENGYASHEMVTGGKFKVHGYSVDHNGTNVVHLQQTETHDPDQLIAQKASQGMKQANTNMPREVDIFGSGLDKFFDSSSNPKTPNQPPVQAPANTNQRPPYIRKNNV